MQVHVLIFFCFFAKIIESNSDSDEAKYIDLLPEEEKQEFLNRIAKRIVAEIKSHNRMDKSSVEISDEKLNEHAAYVEKIMDEETDNFKHERRLGSETLDDKIENNDDSELRGKTFENEDFVVQYKSESDFSPSKNKKRIKKDTNEDSKPLSIENTKTEIDEIVTEIPVRLVYGDENNLNNKAKVKNVFHDVDTVNEDLVENKLEIKGLNTNEFERKDKKSLPKIDNNNKTTDVLYKKKDNDSKEINTDHNLEILQDSYVGYDEMAVTRFQPGTINNDFEPGEQSLPKNHTAVLNKTAEKQIIERDDIKHNDGLTQIILDLDKVELFTSSTENMLKMSSDPADNINNEITSTVDDALVASSQNYSVNTLRPILRNEVLLGTQNNESFSVIFNNTNENILKTRIIEYIPLTTTIDDAINLSINIPKNESADFFLTTSNYSSIDYDFLTNKSTWRETNRSHNNFTSENVMEDTEHSNASVNYLKQALRKGNENSKEEYEFTEKYTSKMKTPNFLSPNDINNYGVFEVSRHNPPFIPSKQINVEFDEQPHYIPVYNYEPNNAFFTGYNHFGPNIDENSKINGAIHHERIPIPDNIKSYKNKHNENFMNSQRNFKLYYKNQESHKPRNIAYSMPTVWKGRFSDINFNPNDYLDMDYYLGRTNGAYNNMYNDFSNIKPKNFVTNKKWQDNLEDVVDPMQDASLEPNNIKTDIANLRNTLYVHKYGKKGTVLDRYNNNDKNTLKTKLRKRKKTLDPILRGLDETFVIFLPDRDKDANDEKNIAVDYYFSRMNSEELHAVHANDPPIERLPDKLDIENKQKNTRVLKIVKEKSGKVIEEKRIHIPLKRDNILKIDLALKNGNKVDVIFRKVKKSETDKDDNYFNSHLIVLKDMIEHDHEGLLLYNWLESTVDIQSAIKKLFDVMNGLQTAQQVHYSDYELFKYILYLFQSSNKLLEDTTKQRSNGKHREKYAKGNFVWNVPLPKVINKKIAGNMEKPLELKTLSKIYEDVEEIQQLSEIISNNTLFEFENYLSDLQTSLNTLHEAIKGIAGVTKFNNQRWFYDLKDLYLSPVDTKVSLTLLLHLVTSKLFSLIEHSAKNGLEDNFRMFVQNHRKEVERTREEFIFALRILKEIKILES